jgi:hypothetical protein
VQLSSDILEQQFGPTEIGILLQDDTTRIICTKTIAASQVLELSKVTFVHDGVSKFPAIHQEILRGQSMGKAFRAHDVAFVRKVQSVQRTPLPEAFSRRFQSNGPATVVEVSILVGEGETLYATILETYSPKVVWPAPNQGTTVAWQAIEQFGRLLSVV